MLSILRILFCISFLACVFAWGAWAQHPSHPLEYRFTGGYGQVEVGGPFAGAEFHESRPLPSRISFYYPVANSIDLSTDYWKRGDSRPMAVGLQMDGGAPRWIGRNHWEYVLQPQAVRFDRGFDSLDCSIRYEFGMKEPMLAVSITFVNRGTLQHRLTGYVHLKTAFRTCQTYARFDSVTVRYDAPKSAVISTFAQAQTAMAGLVVQNMGELPTGWVMDASELSISDTGTSSWRGGALPRGPVGEHVVPGCNAFTYEKTVAPGDSMAIILVIASCRNREITHLVDTLRNTWSRDVETYNRYVDSSAMYRPVLRTGDPWIDRAALWSRALLAANAHYLDGHVVPMPCPAEYNFFFTHDMLLTDLAAVAFDPGRVRKDLQYIAGHAKGNVIPHAYYWRDDGFKTEYCPPDDWNHFWFILTAGSYLRHTGDSTLIAHLYPLLTTSIDYTLRQLHADHLMYAGAPDWWDIGKNEGPRAYMTTLAVRAVREYLFISSFLRRYSPRLQKLEHTSTLMEEGLVARLWDDHAGYLINVNSGRKDPHYYMGSLLAPAFGILDSSRSKILLTTAERELLAPGLGIRTAMPADFHTDSMRAWFHFADNEAGDPYLYANGGVWPHDNAWFALALKSSGRLDDAYRFYRSTMTLDGIANSPMGQPAFYEYRFSDPGSPAYGKIDKPSFMWAAGFTLLTGYRLLGFEETEWNITLSTSFPSALDTARCVFEFRGGKDVRLSRGERGVVADGVPVPSRVVPLRLGTSRSWDVGFAGTESPALLRINAIVHDVRYENARRRLVLIVSSFKGHSLSAEIASIGPLRKVTVDGAIVHDIRLSGQIPGHRVTQVRWQGVDNVQTVVINF